MLKKIGWKLVSLPVQVIAAAAIATLGISVWLLHHIPSNSED